MRAELAKARDAANRISSRMAKVLEQERGQQRQTDHQPQPQQEQPGKGGQAQDGWQREEPQQGRQSHPAPQQQYTREDGR